MEGYRIIAYAYKEINNPDILKEANISRDMFERELNFLGFLILENNLKSDTREVIEELKQADLEVKMITGRKIFLGLIVLNSLL